MIDASNAKKPMSWPKKFGIAVGAIFGVGFIGQVVAGSSGSGHSGQADTAQEKQDKERDYQAYLSAKALKSSLRNPDSLAFISIRASADGAVICLKYRAQNGFGGMGIGHTIFKEGEPSDSAASWNKNCAHKLMYDETAVKDLI